MINVSNKRWLCDQEALEYGDYWFTKNHLGEEMMKQNISTKDIADRKNTEKKLEKRNSNRHLKQKIQERN